MKRSRSPPAGGLLFRSIMKRSRSPPARKETEEDAGGYYYLQHPANKELGEYELVASQGGLRLGRPRMRAEVASALHELVAECEVSDRALSAAAQSLRQTMERSSLRDMAGQVEQEADRCEIEARENPDPHEQALQKLEACQARRLGTAQALVDKKNGLLLARKAVEEAQKAVTEAQRAAEEAQSAVVFAEQHESTAQCDERQAVADLVSLVRGNSGAAKRQSEAAALWRRASEQLAMQAEEESARAFELLRVLGRADARGQDSIATKTASTKKTAIADAVLTFLAEAHTRHAQLIRAAKQAQAEGALL